MQVQPYLFFEGRCEEAIEFYRKALGAEVEMLMRFKESPDPTMVRHELEAYSQKMAEKPELVVLTKLDLLTNEQRAFYLNALREIGLEPLTISAQSGEGMDGFRQALSSQLESMGMISEDTPMPLHKEENATEK